MFSVGTVVDERIQKLRTVRALSNDSVFVHPRLQIFVFAIVLFN